MVLCHDPDCWPKFCELKSAGCGDWKLVNCFSGRICFDCSGSGISRSTKTWKEIEKKGGRRTLLNCNHRFCCCVKSKFLILICRRQWNRTWEFMKEWLLWINGWFWVPNQRRWSIRRNTLKAVLTLPWLRIASESLIILCILLWTLVWNIILLRHSITIWFTYLTVVGYRRFVFVVENLNKMITQGRDVWIIRYFVVVGFPW